MNQQKEDIDEDKHWYGIIYINPHDNRVFVPKRLGLGVTVNFGRPLGVMIAVAFLLFLGWVIYENG